MFGTLLFPTIMYLILMRLKSNEKFWLHIKAAMENRKMERRNSRQVQNHSPLQPVDRYYRAVLVYA